MLWTSTPPGHAQQGFADGVVRVFPRKNKQLSTLVESASHLCIPGLKLLVIWSNYSLAKTLFRQRSPALLVELGVVANQANFPIGHMRCV